MRREKWDFVGEEIESVFVYCFALFLDVCGLRVSGFGWWWCWCVEVSRAIFGGCLGWKMFFSVVAWRDI